MRAKRAPCITKEYGHKITNNSIFLGSYARPNANDETNQIVIGYDAVGAGSNTATIGKTDITKTVLRGNVLANAYLYTSDRSLKTNIATINPTRVLDLREVSFE